MDTQTAPKRSLTDSLSSLSKVPPHGEVPLQFQGAWEGNVPDPSIKHPPWTMVPMECGEKKILYIIYILYIYLLKHGFVCCLV
jgi:hypothetical protein